MFISNLKIKLITCSFSIAIFFKLEYYLNEG